MSPTDIKCHLHSVRLALAKALTDGLTSQVKLDLLLAFDSLGDVLREMNSESKDQEAAS